MREAVCAVLLSLLPALSPAQSMFRGDPAHSGVAQGRGPRELHGVKWKFPTGGPVISSPVAQNGVIYFGSDDGNVYAVDAATGLEKWRFATGGPVPSTPAIAGGLVYFPSYDGRFYALTAATGRIRWTFTTGGERRFEARGIHGMLPKTQTIPDPFDVFLSSPVVVGDAVYFGSGDGKVYALDALSGDLRWDFATGDVVHASPAYSAGVLYFGSWDSVFYAVDAATGKEKWRFKGGVDPVIHNQVGFQSSPVVWNGMVYTGSRDSNVYAFDAVTGHENWRVSTDLSWVITSPAVAQGKVIFATSDSSLYHAVDAATGKGLLKEQLKAYVFSSPTVAGDVVYVGVLNGTLEARDLNTGAPLWQFQTEAARRNQGWALKSDGSFNGPFIYRSPWREEPILGFTRQMSVGSIFSTPLVLDGVIYFGSADGFLYAVS